MNLLELTGKPLNQMTKEELEQYALSLLDEMINDAENMVEKIENAKRNRTTDNQTV